MKSRTQPGLLGLAACLAWGNVAGAILHPYTDASVTVLGSSDREESTAGAVVEAGVDSTSSSTFNARVETGLGYNKIDLGFYDETRGQAYAGSYWEDRLTYSGSDTDGSVEGGIYLHFSLFDYEASELSLRVYQDGQLILDLDHDDDGVCYGVSGACDFSELLDITLNVRPAEAFDMAVSLYGWVTASDDNTLGYVEAFNTAAFSYLALPGGFTGLSGNQYPVPYTPPSAVPLPASLPLLLSGLFGMGFVARRRARRGRGDAGIHQCVTHAGSRHAGR